MFFLRYDESVSSPAKFWGKIVEQFHWETPPSEEKFLDFNFDVTKGPIRIEWMKDGKTNVCYNCLDRHLEKRGDQVKHNPSIQQAVCDKFMFRVFLFLVGVIKKLFKLS